MSRADTDFVSYVIVAVLLVSLWTHREAILRPLHTLEPLGLILLLLSAVIGAVKLYKRLQGPGATINTMTGLEFERYVAGLLKNSGYKQVKLTEEYDLGVDIVAEKNGVIWGIQVKRYSGLVGADAVRQVVTALPMYRCDKAMVITNSTFSRPAMALADANSCLLIDGNQLAKTAAGWTS